jgi:hypothetical protein
MFSFSSNPMIDLEPTFGLGGLTAREDSIDLTFANGSVNSAPWMAGVGAGVNFTGIRSGADFY